MITEYKNLKAKCDFCGNEYWYLAQHEWQLPEGWGQIRQVYGTGYYDEHMLDACPTCLKKNTKEKK
jgi:hypothetical protein